MAISNDKLARHAFLQPMYDDGYFPRDLVDKGAKILLDMCEQIEAQPPKGLGDLYALTHAATERFNALAGEFEERGSEIETVAREAIGEEFRIIAEAYGFANADSEELIAPRDW